MVLRCPVTALFCVVWAQRREATCRYGEVECCVGKVKWCDGKVGCSAGIAQHRLGQALSRGVLVRWGTVMCRGGKGTVVLRSGTELYRKGKLKTPESFWS